MNARPRPTVLIVGSGPVGLYLGIQLALYRIPFAILERRPERLLHSRSIGIHPPALEVLEPLGVVPALLSEGVKVRAGHAFGDRGPLGVVRLTSCPEPYPFVLTLAQHRTEAVLERRLLELAPGALERGCELVGLRQHGDGVDVTIRHHRDGSEAVRRFAYVVGCDGRNSAVRSLCGIAYPGLTYPDSYLMGDFADSTDLGTDAAIYLTADGVVEAFPLPGGLRRWVVKTPTLVATPRADELADLVESRLGIRVPSTSNTMLSNFGIERHLADRFSVGRVSLAGDAAHVISPIGGQGMNLGWLDAAMLSGVLRRTLHLGEPAPPLFDSYSHRRRRAAQRAMFRADLNTRLGRAWRWTWPRDTVLRAVLRTPLEGFLARVVTMRWL